MLYYGKFVFRCLIMLYLAQSLPPISKISLDDWQLIKVSGVDNSKFLQGQLTADINELNDNHWLFSAHCDPKGKTLANLLIFKRHEDIYYLVRKSVVDIHLKELKKYAIFSKVSITIESSLSVLGLAGTEINSQNLEALATLTSQNNCHTVNNLTFIKIDFPTDRYLIIGTDEKIAEFIAPLSSITTLPASQWALLDMQANYPIIDAPVSHQFLPQAFNLQQFAAISFTKGCYCGQEMVARAQYRGINKRSLYLLIGEHADSVEIGDTLEQKLGDSWRETGCILASFVVNNQIWVQAILNNEIPENEATFRLKNNHQILTIINN